MMKDTSWDNLSKREKLQISRQRAKLEKILGSIADLTRLPAALFVVDVMKEKIAVREAQRLGIPVFAIVDTNSNPDDIDFVIPANDDASQAIKIIIGAMCDAIREGLNERKMSDKDKEDEDVISPKLRRKVKFEVEPEEEEIELEAEEDDAEIDPDVEETEEEN
jgi:small subunit ribosomal protein S2